MARQFLLSKISFLNRSFLASTFLDSWGEDDPITGQIVNGDFDEPLSVQYWCFFAAAAKPNSLMLDVGSFTGLFALVATAMRDDVKVVAFEPSAVTFGRLIDNIRWNGRDLQIIPANLAASDAPEFLRFPHQYGILSMSPGESLEGGSIPDHTQSARSIALDALLKPQSELPDFLNSKAIPFGPLADIAAVKIDVEGHEERVLHGAIELIKKFRPHFICEALNHDASSRLARFFTEMQYRCISIESERNIVFIPEEKFEETTSKFEAWRSQNQTELRGERVFSYLAR